MKEDRSCQKIKILVVDDDVAVLNFFKRLLKDDVFELTAVSEGMDALRQTEHNDFDLAFIDIVLKDINGIELCAKIKEKKPDLGVILITGYPEREEEAVTRLGIQGIFWKPFGIDKIFSEIDKIKRVKGL